MTVRVGDAPNDPGGVRRRNEICGEHPGTSPSGSWVRVDCGAPLSGRYVSVQAEWAPDEDLPWDFHLWMAELRVVFKEDDGAATAATAAAAASKCTLANLPVPEVGRGFKVDDPRFRDGRYSGAHTLAHVKSSL